MKTTSFEKFELEITVNYPVHTWTENGSFMRNLTSWLMRFLPRDAMHKRGICRHPVSVCTSVRPSVRPTHSWVAPKRKNRCFHVPQPTFLFPLATPLRLSRNMLHGWKDNSMLSAYQTLRSMYLSVFYSFRVIRCLSQCVSPKIAIFTTFLFPLGTPLEQSR